MGDSRDKVRADCRSRQTRPLSRKITTVCCQESRFRAVDLLGRIDLAAIKSSSASACTDALAASLTFGGDPQIRRTRHPCVLRWRSAENDHDAPLFFSVSMSTVVDLREATCTFTVSSMSTAFAEQSACATKVDVHNRPSFGVLQPRKIAR